MIVFMAACESGKSIMQAIYLRRWIQHMEATMAAEKEAKNLPDYTLSPGALTVEAALSLAKQKEKELEEERLRREKAKQKQRPDGGVAHKAFIRDTPDDDPSNRK